MKYCRIIILLILGMLFSASLHSSPQDQNKDGDQSMEEIIMSMENGAMERWRKGDPWGFTDISAQEVTYFDTGTPKRVDGLESL